MSPNKARQRDVNPLPPEFQILIFISLDIIIIGVRDSRFYHSLGEREREREREGNVCLLLKDIFLGAKVILKVILKSQSTLMIHTLINKPYPVTGYGNNAYLYLIARSHYRLFPRNIALISYAKNRVKFTNIAMRKKKKKKKKNNRIK